MATNNVELSSGEKEFIFCSPIRQLDIPARQHCITTACTEHHEIKSSIKGKFNPNKNQAKSDVSHIQMSKQSFSTGSLIQLNECMINKLYNIYPASDTLGQRPRMYSSAAAPVSYGMH